MVRTFASLTAPRSGTGSKAESGRAPEHRGRRQGPGQGCRDRAVGSTEGQLDSRGRETDLASMERVPLLPAAFLQGSQHGRLMCSLDTGQPTPGAGDGKWAGIGASTVQGARGGYEKRDHSTDKETEACQGSEMSPALAHWTWQSGDLNHSCQAQGLHSQLRQKSGIEQKFYH